MEMKDPLMKDYLESRNNTCLYNFNDPPFKRFLAVPNWKPFLLVFQA